MARKAWLTLAAPEPLDTESLEAYADASRVLRVLRPFTFGIVMALAVAGAWLTRDRWRRLAVLYAAFGALAASVVVFFVFARYRFPLVPIAILFAGAALARIWERRRVARDWLPAAGIALALAVVLHLPVRTSADETYFNYGSEFLRLGRPSDAIPMLENALRQDAEHPQARLSLALALQQTGQTGRAIEAFRAAIAANPVSPEAHAGLAIALHQQGEVEGAVRSYREAIRLKPQFAEAMSNLGLALQQLGRTPEAIEQFEHASRLQPQNAALLMNLGSLLLEAGRNDDAMDAFRGAAASSSKPQEVLQAEYALAQAQLKAGRPRDAIASLERALTAANAAGETGAAATIRQGLESLRR
jgi:tetratricopeptide (TPR) repeat protein